MYNYFQEVFNRQGIFVIWFCFPTLVASSETTTFVPVSLTPSSTPHEQTLPSTSGAFPTQLETCPLPDAAYCKASATISGARQHGEAVAGMPLGQALVNKGLARSNSECSPLRSSLFAPHPPDQKGYLLDALSSMYDTPKNNTLAPVSKQGVFSTVPLVDIPDNYDKPRSWTTVDHSLSPMAPQDRAQTLSNGYMAPRQIQPHFSPRYPNYDYPPPPRPLEKTAATGQHCSATLQSDPDDTPSTPSAGLGDYVNFQPLLEDQPPPIDRSTKPYPPKVDRSTKPDRRNSTGQRYIGSPPKDIQSISPPPSASSHSSHSSSFSSESEEPFSASDIPRPFHRSVQYTQVSFLPLMQPPGPAQQQPQLVVKGSEQVLDQQQQGKRPVPAPRTKSPHIQHHFPNYTQIDLAATSALRWSEKDQERCKREQAQRLYALEGESSSESETESDEGYLRMTVS